MSPGDLVRWTFAKTSDTVNRENKYYLGLLLESVERPINSWMVMLSVGEIVHGDETEIEEIDANESR